MPSAAQPVYVGVDLGGTKTLALAATADGTVLGRAVNPTKSTTSAELVVSSMVETAREALAEAGLEPAFTRAVAIAAAGAIRSENGAIVWSPHIASMSDTPVVDMFQQHWDVPLTIGNDANLAALGEQRYGAGRGVSDLLFITVSTGIGGGIVIDDKLYTGALGFAGEIGHMTVDAHGPYGKSTTPGAWEAMCSGTSLVRIATERITAGEASSMRAAVKRGRLDAEAIFAAMREGDTLAASVIGNAIEYLGAGLTSLVNVLNPGLLVVGGGLANEWDAYIAPAVEIMRRQSFAGVGRDTPVVPPALGGDSGALGAVALAATLR